MNAFVLAAADLGQALANRNFRFFLTGAAAAPDLIERVSPEAAARAARHAMRRVPAYRDFLEQRGWRDDRRLRGQDWLRTLPETDKNSYVRAFSTEERCIDGRIPMAGTQIDESAGSTGIAYSWVRSPAELEALHRSFGHYVRFLFGNQLISINAFSMGAWATGINAGEGLRRVGMVKSTGPDVDRIEGTLRFFGPAYAFLLTGYPPFLKELVDRTEARGFEWSDYRCGAIVGGEAISEGLRAYLERRFGAVYSVYGASDLDIGVAGEAPLSVFVRRAAAESLALRRDLFGDDSRLPMLFQYNPLDHHVETNEAGELVITVNRRSLLSPRIRYNVHDAGGTLTFADLVDRARQHGIDPVTAVGALGAHPVFRLPFLYVFGRSDSTVSYMGANIYPEDIQAALYADMADAARIGAFSLEVLEVAPSEDRPCIHVEVVHGPIDDPDLADRLRHRVLQRLLAWNADFRNAVEETPHAADIQVRLHPERQGPFAMNSGRIKRRYVVEPTA